MTRRALGFESLKISQVSCGGSTSELDQIQDVKLRKFIKILGN